METGVLIVDDEEAARYGMRRALEKEGYSIAEAGNLDAARRALDKSSPKVVILDMKLNQEAGIDFLPELVSMPNPPAVLIVTAHGTERIAVETMKLGAFDYIPKPFDVDELRLVVRNAAESVRLRDENERLREALTGSEGTYGDMIGESPAMKKVYSVIEKVAETGANVLIIGESGTGKELVAREIHRRSGRTGRFVAVNCAALPQELIESELFGHEKGAFTGAVTRRAGKFEAADEGTIFLDEVGDMSPATQAKILRVVEERKFQRLGGNETLDVDVRIISATNRDIDGSRGSAGSQFREDLFYRLSVVTIRVPALRERKSDIAALVRTFAARYSVAYRNQNVVVSENAYGALLRFDWPGNVRQLRNVVEHATIMCNNKEITLNDLPPEILENSLKLKEKKSDCANDLLSRSRSLKDAKHEFERLYIEKCLEDCGGNISRAALQLGIHRQSLQHKIKDLGLTKRFTLSD